MDVSVLVDRADMDEMREEGAGRIELLAVDDKRVAVAKYRRLEGADVAAFRLGEGVAEPIALKHATEPKALLLFRRGHPDRVQRRQMILRQLTQIWIGGRNNGDDLGERGERHSRPAIGLGHRYRPQARAGKAIELLRRQTALAVALGRLAGEFGGELARDRQRFLIRPDTVGVRRQIEARRPAA